MIKISKLIGYRGWKAWMSYDMHISFLALFYILIVDNLFRLLDSLVLISSLGFYFMYGFLINDFFDMPYDIASGKKRTVHELSRNEFIAIILTVVLISMLHLLYLKEIPYTMVYIASYLLATLYSTPPIKFKSRGFAGIVVNGLIEKTLPVLAIFTFFNHFWIDTIIFIITSFFVQISEIITHQIYDYETDSREGCRTFVVNIGKEKALKIFKKFISPLSTSFMLLLCLCIIIRIPPMCIIAIVVFVAYAVIFSLISKGKLNREEKVFPLYMSCPHFLINNAFPPFLAFIISLRDPLYSILLLISVLSQYYMVKNFFNIIRRKVILRGELSDTT